MWARESRSCGRQRPVWDACDLDRRRCRTQLPGRNLVLALLDGTAGGRMSEVSMATPARVGRSGPHLLHCLMPPVVLTIAGFDPSSGAGVTADVKTIAAHGCYGVGCITALTVQSTT